MAGALAAFFGVPLGGSLFALEVNSRFGIEYFEHTLEAIFCGEVCLAVFRGLSGLPIAPIWIITSDKLTVSRPIDIMYGAILGLLGGLTAWLFARFHRVVTGVFRRLSLLQSSNAVPRALVASVAVVALGLLVPQTLFWGEFEFQSIATLAPSSSLSHIWPTSGLIGFEMNSFGTSLVVGVAKLVAVSFTVAGGYRGGYIFPCFAAAAALGRAVFFVMPFIPVQLCVLCMAAALNVALTRTAIASTLILSFLSGEQCTVPSILAASLMSLFVTAYMPFIHTQHSRADLDDAIFYEFEFELDAMDDPPASQYNTDATDETATTDDLLTPVSVIHKTMSANESRAVHDDHTDPMVAVL
jgi:H+/Cl- antiporter ClcA